MKLDQLVEKFSAHPCYLKMGAGKMADQFNASISDVKAAKELVKSISDINLPTSINVHKNVLVIGDLHAPFIKEGYLEFCKEIYTKHNCNEVVFIGDIIDNHFSSFHDTDADGHSAGEELRLAILEIQKWYEAFPVAKVCLGNHDLIPNRKSFNAGLSKKWIRTMDEVLNTPNWTYDEEFIIDKVLYTHGTGRKAAPRMKADLISIVQGHYHSESYVQYSVGKFSKLFAMQVGCVDGETEFLSRSGWKKISEYRSNDDVCQFNEEEKIAEFVKPQRYIKEKCEEVYYLKNKYGLSQKLSSDHNVLYLTRSGEYKKITTDKLVEKHNSNKNGFENKLPTEFYLIQENSMIDLSDAEIRVQIMFNADGTLLNYNPGGAVTFKKDRKIKRAEVLLKEANLEYKRFDYKDGITRFIFSPPIEHKKYTKDWYSASTSQLKVISDEILLWDGDQEKRFTSKNKEDVDFAQFVFSSMGYRTHIRHDDRVNKECYDMTISKKKNGRIISENSGENISKVKTSDGFKYCFTVPSGNLILRHDNSVFVTGNCGVDDKSYAMAYGKHFNKSHINCGVVLEDGQLPILEYMKL